MSSIAPLRRPAPLARAASPRAAPTRAETALSPPDLPPRGPLPRSPGASGGATVIALRAAPLGSDGPVEVLSATLRDPATGRPPTATQVAAELGALLAAKLPAAGPEALAAVADQPREAYYVMTYDEGSGALALRRVAGGDEGQVTVARRDVEAAVGAGEVLLGGLHNHPERGTPRVSDADRRASALLGRRFQGYVDYVIGRDRAVLRVEPAPDVPDHGAAATFEAWRPGAMNRDPNKPPTVERVDSAHVDVPNAQSHAHFVDKDRGSYNEDGTWGHNPKKRDGLTNREKRWFEFWK